MHSWLVLTQLMQNAGLISVRWHRELAKGKLKNIIILHNASGWYACFQVEQAEPETERSAGPAVGIDMDSRTR